MKNQNPQDILNEILLRMKYDSSMTLSENKKIIDEQRTPYYDSQGFLKYVDGPVAIPQGGVAASKVYPNLKPGEYPNYNFTLGATAKPVPFNKPQIPQSDVLGPQGSYIRSLGIDRQSLETKAALKAKQDEKLKDIAINKGMYQNELNALKKKYNIDGMISPQNYVPTNMDNYKEELNNYIKKYNLAQLQFSTEKIKLDKKYGLWKFPVESFDLEIDIPKNSTKEFFKKEDFKDSNTIKKSFHTKLNDSQLKRFTTNEPSGTYVSTPSWTPTKGDLFDWIWSKVKNEIRFFILPEPYNQLEWKKRLYINNSGYFTVSDKYYAQGTDGQFIEYIPLQFRNKTFWEDNGPNLLNLASFAISMIFPATWPLLLVSAGLDVASAKMQYDQGETTGAKLSLLLALVPFVGKYGIKINPTISKNLLSKFGRVTSESDVQRIILGLNQEELKTLQSLRSLDDIKGIMKNINNDPAVIKAIEDAAKKIPGISKAGLMKGTLEAGLSGVLFVSALPEIAKEELDNLSRVATFNKVKNQILESTNITEFMNSNDKKIVESDISELIPLESMITECKKQSQILRDTWDKVAKKEYDKLQEDQRRMYDEVDKKLKFLQEQPNKLTEDGNKKLSEDEKNEL